MLYLWKLFRGRLEDIGLYLGIGTNISLSVELC